MDQEIDTPTRINHPRECQSLLEALCLPGGASLLFTAQSEQPHPVLVMAVQADEQLLLDITAVPELATRIARHETFQLCGQVDGSMLRTSPLRLLQRLEVPERLQFTCAYPEWLELLHRRSSFRAELRADMPVRVELHAAGLPQPLHGRLINLSLGGCLVELTASQAVRIDGPQQLDQLVLRFPGGQQFAAGARICHMHGLPDWQNVRFGCQFVAVTSDHERRLWLYVREIEREKARNAHAGERDLRPSALFAERTPPQALRRAPASPPPGAGILLRLGRVAGYLDLQLIQLRLGAAIDSAQLSRYSDLLLGLLGEDRDGLLFAIQHLGEEPLLVQHGIALAVRLADMTTSRSLPTETIKAIVASGLVHDLGKALLPADLQSVRHLDAGQRQAFGVHVDLLRERLESCKWLAAPVVEAVVGSINERLDGSGYPQSVAAQQIGELTRMASVADVVDAMGRPRLDRPAQPIDAIYRHLLGCGSQFDQQWSQRYIRHFGLFPVGSLVRFGSGQLAWVRRLDRDGQVAEVQLAANPAANPHGAAALVSDGALLSLGRIEAVVVPEI